MTPDDDTSTTAPRESAALDHTLDQSELVRHRVEQAAADLFEVNAILKTEVAGSGRLANIERALDQSAAIETEVCEAAADLAVVNDALANEIDERHLLENKLVKSENALSASRTAERRSRHDALHDTTTGLPNLTLFTDRLSAALAQAERHDWHVGVMFIDLDRFKQINDSYGHDAGDKMLQVVAERLLAMVRSGDTVSRRSGDEFLFLMIEAGDETSVSNLAARIAERLGEACEIDGVTLHVTASIGIAVYPKDGTSPQELLKNADAAMYVAKQSKSHLP